MSMRVGELFDALTSFIRWLKSSVLGDYRLLKPCGYEVFMGGKSLSQSFPRVWFWNGIRFRFRRISNVHIAISRFMSVMTSIEN